MRSRFSCSTKPWANPAVLLVVLLFVFATQPTPSPAAETSTNSSAPKPSTSWGQRFVSLLKSTGPVPTTFPDAQTFIYRDLKPEPLRLFVVKPDGWRTNDHRPAMIFFFGGGWTRGDPGKSIGWARLAAKWGMVGIAPDYRTADRFNTTPVEAVADARAAMRWVQDHAAELGVDKDGIVAGGSSAGGHLALWTAIAKAPFGSNPEESPVTKPAALVLISAPGDTTPAAWGNSAKLVQRFGPHIGAVSPLQHLDPNMPPVIMFHGDADETVPYGIAVALHEKLVATSNTCEFVTIASGKHGFQTQLPEWKEKTRTILHRFLTQQGILPPTNK